MAEKKDRSRFSIKFNEKDPAHDMVISLLEQQSPRNKASFIANAILHYIHCPETPDITQTMVAVQTPGERQAPMVDKAAIEAIVIEILSRQQESKQELIKEIERDIPTRIIASEAEMQDKKQMDEAVETNIDNDMRALIASTMSAFRNI